MKFPRLDPGPGKKHYKDHYWGIWWEKKHAVNMTVGKYEYKPY